jgi:hypothetical protein
MKEERRFLKSPANSPAVLIEPDEDKGIEAPPIQKPYPSDAELLDLIAPERFSLGETSLIAVLKKRKSRRKYVDEAGDGSIIL